MKRGTGIDISGQRFGRLIAIELAPRVDGYARWRCACDCGQETIARSQTLRNGRTKSCGCLARELASIKNASHGATRGGSFTPEYSSYRKMRERCLNPRHKYFKNYGGRGVTICAQWLAGFENFLADMGKRPTLGHSIDRIDPFGNYEPSNCRWATRKEQNNNTRKKRAA